MKTIYTFLLAGAIAGGLAAGTQARADVCRSQHAQAIHNQRIPISISSPALASGSYLGAGQKAADVFPAVTPGIAMPGPSLVGGNYLGAGQKAADLPPAVTAGIATIRPSLISGSYLGAAAKNPAPDLRGTQFEIAPVVEKAHPAQCGGCCQGK